MSKINNLGEKVKTPNVKTFQSFPRRYYDIQIDVCARQLIHVISLMSGVRAPHYKYGTSVSLQYQYVVQYSRCKSTVAVIARHVENVVYYYSTTLNMNLVQPRCFDLKVSMYSRMKLGIIPLGII